MARRGSNRYSKPMSTTVTISDALAAALEARRKAAGIPTIDAAAEFLLADAIEVDASDLDAFGLSDEALRALIAEGEASGPPADWDPQAVRDEVRRRFSARTSG